MHDALVQLDIRKPPGAAGRVDEGRQRLLPRDTHRPRRTGNPAIGAHPLAHLPQPACQLVAGCDRLDIPRQLWSPLDLRESTGQRRVLQGSGVPAVEQLEPLLPSASGALPDPLIRARETGHVSCDSLLRRCGEQPRSRRGVALARLGHAGSYEPLERSLRRHRDPLAGRARCHSRWRASRREETRERTGAPRARAPYAPTSRWREHRDGGSAKDVARGEMIPRGLELVKRRPTGCRCQRPVDVTVVASDQEPSAEVREQSCAEVVHGRAS